MRRMCNFFRAKTTKRVFLCVFWFFQYSVSETVFNPANSGLRPCFEFPAKMEKKTKQLATQKYYTESTNEANEANEMNGDWIGG